MSEAQVAAMCDWLGVHDPFLLMVCRVIYYTFARPIELYRLKVGDVSTSKAVIFFDAKITKARKQREARLPAVANEMIKGYLDKNQSDTSWHFLGHLGRPSLAQMGDETLARRHGMALVACGLNGIGISLYSWKHTGVCAAFDKGMALSEISERCGHAELSTTERYLRDLRRSRPLADLADW